MNCSECEQLFDAYLDGHLAGSLRLEFDAHRLRCPHCQQTLAMLETIGHVIAADTHQQPDLSPGFTDRVLAGIARPRTRILHFPYVRAAVVVGALAQAAAVLAIALLWTSRPAVDPVPGSPTDASPADAGVTNDPAYRAVLGLIAEKVEDHLWEMYSTGTQITADVKNLARYLNVSVPEDVVRESSKVAGVNPWQFFWGTLSPTEEQEPEPMSSAEDIHSI
jgi:hypothetical protein